MGLPMFEEPDVVDYKIKSKADPTAPARSAIRRQRTVRYSSNTRGHQTTPATSNSRRGTSVGRTRQLADRRSLLEDIRRRDPDLSNPSAEIVFNEVSDLEGATVQGGPFVSHAADLARAEASQRSRQFSGRAHLRDALSYERAGQRVWASRDAGGSEVLGSEGDPQRTRAAGTQDVLRLPQLQDGQAPPSERIPTPPFMFRDVPAPFSLQGNDQAVGSATLTPGFAPAHGILPGGEVHSIPTREQSLVALAQIPSSPRDAQGTLDDQGRVSTAMNTDRMGNSPPDDLSQDHLGAEADYLRQVGMRLNILSTRDAVRPTRHDHLADLPSLRRMSRQGTESASRTSGSRSQEANLDGLGDRQRSFSPDDDAWETMLTTIPPDDRVPSAHSSFTTTTPSASSLSTNSASSYGTLVTAPSTIPENESCPAEISDSEDDSMFEEVDDVSLRDRYRGSTRFLAQSEEHLNRIESLSQRLTNQRSRGDRISRHRRMLEREDELRHLEYSLQRLERQIAEERTAAASRQRPTGARARQERL